MHQLQWCTCVSRREWRHGGPRGCGPRHSTAFPLSHPISCAFPPYDRQPERDTRLAVHAAVWVRVVYWQRRGVVLLLDIKTEWMVHVNFKSPMNHLVFLITAQKECGKEHDTSSLRARDPDKHVYALGSFISEFNKSCFRRGWFQWEIQLDVPSIHILGCRDFIRYGILL